MPNFLRILRVLILLTLLLIQVGCAGSDADLDYTRDKPIDNSKDNSYHGWNNANN